MLKALASITKSGLSSKMVSLWRPSKNSDCHWRTMPKRWLSSSTILTGIWRRLSVPSSCTFIMKEPSPLIRID
ncbi:Uncharacterised protein [Vibrio cholerae]|nr:Uncharacterised protein [Vibrio cholerae]